MGTAIVGVLAGMEACEKGEVLESWKLEEHLLASFKAFIA